MTYDELLETFSAYGFLDRGKIDLLKKYADHLIEENKKYNLTAITEVDEIVEKHFYDCMLPLKETDLHGKSLLDVGSGGGFPGLVYAILFPDCSITLMDATAKKCRFLEETSALLHLKNVKVINSRAEDYKSRDAFEIVTARAVASMSKVLEITVPFTCVNGTILLLKGAKGEDELKESEKAVRILNIELFYAQRCELQNGDQRINYFFKKKAVTPLKYPRAWKDISSKPLS